MRQYRLFVASLLLVACGGGAAAPKPVVVPSPVGQASPAQPAGAAPVAPKDDGFRARVKEVTGALRAHDLARAASLLDKLEAEVGSRHPRVEIVAYYRAALAAYAGDLAGTRAAFERQLAAGGAPGDATMTFGYHNALVMVRTAMADLPGAIVECNLMTEAGPGPPFSEDADGRNLVLLKRYWHEAYLLRMAAAMVPAGFFHEGALAASRRAREEFRALSRSIVGAGDPSVAVLDAYFAVHDGDRAAALAAARSVDITADDDIEDLYLVQMGLDFGGDAAGAATVRARIAKLDEASVAVPIMALFIARDLDAAAGKPALWTPRHPRGARP
jgi:hypothetical protein